MPTLVLPPTIPPIDPAAATWQVLEAHVERETSAAQLRGERDALVAKVQTALSPVLRLPVIVLVLYCDCLSPEPVRQPDPSRLGPGTDRNMTFAS